MELFPLDHRPTDGFDARVPQAAQPSAIFGWVSDRDGLRAAVYSFPRNEWLLADGLSAAKRPSIDVQRLLSREFLSAVRTAH